MREGITRRHLLALGGVAFGGLLMACSGDDSDGGDTSGPAPASEQKIGVDVPEYPFWDNDVIVVGREALDELARRYAAEQEGDELDLERFLFGWMPAVLFDDALSTPGLTQQGERLWMLYLSGYFGGVWLRGAIDKAQPGTSRLAGIAVEASEDAFRAKLEGTSMGLDAAGGADDGAIAYCETSLFPQGEGGIAGDGLAQGFGYNQGYMLEILERPPEGLGTPLAYRITCRQTLACDHATPRLEVLATLAPVADALTAAEGAYADLGPRLRAEQDAFVPTGRLVWSTGLSVQGFTQRDYETLLDVSASFLQTLQATALFAAKAVAERDGDSARHAAFANAQMNVWLTAYTTGLLEGRNPPELPSFTRV